MRHTQQPTEPSRTARADKRDFVETLAAEAEEAAVHGNMKDLYNTTNKLSGKFTRPERPVKDKHERAIQSEEGQKNTWLEHLKVLLNRPAPRDSPDIQAAESDLPINSLMPRIDLVSRKLLANYFRNCRNTNN